jgi:hypothetical protein
MQRKTDTDVEILSLNVEKIHDLLEKWSAHIPDPVVQI